MGIGATAEIGGTDLLSRSPWVARRHLALSEYHRMGEAGIRSEDGRVELIEGELIAMAPIGSGHSHTVITATHLWSVRGPEGTGDDCTSIARGGRSGSIELVGLPVSSSPLQRFSAKPFALDAACGARPLSA
jgi:hypothetical protein